jgi:hypothetical protein
MSTGKRVGVMALQDRETYDALDEICQLNLPACAHPAFFLMVLQFL